MMIVRSPVSITLRIIVDPVVDHLILATGRREGLTTVEHPRRIKGPTVVQPIHPHDINVMATVVVGVIPLPPVDTIDTGLRPRERVTDPTRQTPAVLSGTEFHAITLPFTSQHQTLDLDLTAERLAVLIVQHIPYLPVIALDAEVIVLPGGHQIEAPAPLVGCLRLHDVTAHGVAVEGGRRTLVPQGMQVLRGPGITQLDARLWRRLPTDTRPGLQRQMGLHDLVLTIVVVPADVPVALDVIVERTAQRHEGIHPQTH